MGTIKKSTFHFLNQLKSNNNREWFQEHKDTFDKEYVSVISFADSALEELTKHDMIETVSGKKSVYRIYRDIRFSKDKTPYKTFFSGYFRRATNLLRGGYYFHIEPGNCFVAGGFWNPNSEDLLRIRKEISIDSSELKIILNDSNFIKNFGELKGNRLKTVPRGFDINHKDLHLLQLKQYLVVKKISDEDVLKENFYLKVNETFAQMRPLFNYMSEVLTTDENGVSIY
ncbi:DUF2461 domain-containing protein [Urechidicola croceus]|uniref:TIGR02453 family protein n=1 Tax=Urechidicola croceus TaxID=1850246 RepID=A0A1D8P577_9FLAO|nr:DUF2461 domain-containing protein [Urechidicola croceus]AOW19725.1 TIGR02453 family protein [Urechidicola croceus]